MVFSHSSFVQKQPFHLAHNIVLENSEETDFDYNSKVYKEQYQENINQLILYNFPFREILPELENSASLSRIPPLNYLSAFLKYQNHQFYILPHLIQKYYHLLHHDELHHCHGTTSTHSKYLIPV